MVNTGCRVGISGAVVMLEIIVKDSGVMVGRNGACGHWRIFRLVAREQATSGVAPVDAT